MLDGSFQNLVVCGANVLLPDVLPEAILPTLEAIRDFYDLKTHLFSKSGKLLCSLCRQEKLEMEAKSQSEEKPLDYLEPFLAQLNPDEIRDGKLTRQQAYKLREDCLAHLKQRLIEKANLIQSRFEKVKDC